MTPEKGKRPSGRGQSKISEEPLHATSSGGLQIKTSGSKMVPAGHVCKRIENFIDYIVIRSIML